ncbi:hypothetical protein C3989_00291 [Escherichia coli]|nr:hypothetical protein C3989_00291 [Escherichia coli]
MVEFRCTTPVTQAQITVAAQFQVIAPVFNAHPGSGVIAGQVMIDKHIDARHPARGEITPADTVVGLSAIIRMMKCVLAEDQVIRRFVPGMEKFE